MKECPKCRNCYDDEIEICPVDNESPIFTINGSTTISGRYILECRLGQGGMGIVFRAKHKFLKSSHAIKIILPSLVEGDENLLVRFHQEAILAASIDHPNVIRVTDFGVENDIMPFLVMEFIDGIPMSNYLIEGKPLALKNAFELFIPVAQGVAEAHRKGIVHRDLKPQNIMVQKNLPLTKAIKVLDFGLAKIKSADSFPSMIQAKTMNIVGSPPYMSPEQWSGEGVDHRTDIYALAVLLYQMVNGRLPFMADSMPAMMYQHLTVMPPSAASLGVSLLPGIEDVVFKALEKDPNQRYDSMDVMLAELGNALGGSGNQDLAGASTEVMMPSVSSESPTLLPHQTALPLSDSQKKRFYSYFDSNEKPELVADPQLAQDFLQAQDRIQSAVTEAVNSEMLVQELVEAQKQAEEAQNKAIHAKERIEADVRRQVEAEMERLAVEDQKKRDAESQRLAQEIEARRVAEERANYLAQAALEAQQLAESERKKSQKEAQQRELDQGVRREAEIEAQKLAVQVTEARKQYEDAKNEAAREAHFRAEAEVKQKKIENELQTVAINEAERRKSVEAQAKKQIEEQAGRFETEALAAKQRLDEARLLIELEAEKREQAEVARLHAEEEAQRLSQEIIEVQRQMQEMRQSITYDSEGRTVPSQRQIVHESLRETGLELTSMTQRSGQTPSEIPFGLLNTSGTSNRKPLFAGLAIGIAALFLLVGIGGIALYLFVSGSSPDTANKNVKGNLGDNTALSNSSSPILKQQVFIEGSTFKMGRDDIKDTKNKFWGDQYPAHSVPVNSFHISKFETTNAQYAEFAKDTGRKPPKDWSNGNPPAGKDAYPVTNVSLTDAKAYAAWVSTRENKICRLPTENEWEYAARNGAQDTPFPWGTDWQQDKAILNGEPVAVGTSKDETLAGVKDMLGNVSEWTSTQYSLYPGHPSELKNNVGTSIFVVRGLNFKTQNERFNEPNFLLTTRQDAPEGQAFEFVGFRLVCEL